MCWGKAAWLCMYRAWEEEVRARWVRLWGGAGSEDFGFTWWEQGGHCRHWLLLIRVVLWRGQEGWGGKPTFRVSRGAGLGGSWRAAGVRLGPPAAGCPVTYRGVGWIV